MPPYNRSSEGTVRMVSQTFKPRMKLLRETNDKKFSLPKHKAKIAAPKKTIGCLYQFANIKTEIKEIKDRENAHRCLYWFTLNSKLHPVFS